MGRALRPCSLLTEDFVRQDFELALWLGGHLTQPRRIPDLDPIDLTEQDGFLAKSGSAHQCRWDRDASLRVHRHLASIHQERARECTPPTISHGNLAQPVL